MEEWVNSWLAERRKLGEKGLEVKNSVKDTMYIDLQLTDTKHLRSGGKSQFTLGILT